MVMYGAAVDYLTKKFGGSMSEDEDIVTSTTTAAPLLGNDPDAMMLTMVNLGTNVAYLGLDSRVSATRGLYLAPNGGSISMNVDEDGTLPCRDWHVISPSGNTAIYFLRTRRTT